MSRHTQERREHADPQTGVELGAAATIGIRHDGLAGMDATFLPPATTDVGWAGANGRLLLIQSFIQVGTNRFLATSAGYTVGNSAPVTISLLTKGDTDERISRSRHSERRHAFRKRCGLDLRISSYRRADRPPCERCSSC